MFEQLIPILIPLLTGAIKKGNAGMKMKIPKPLYLLVAWGVAGIVQGVSQVFGVELPTELMSEDTIKAFAMNTTFMASVGVFMREVYDQGKKIIVKLKG